MDDKILKFYGRKEIQREILEAAKNREIAVKYSDKGYGKRPDVLLYENDIYELAKQGATSFHISEERWKDPLQLRTGTNRKELDNLRDGFDVVIDIDTNFLEYSKICADIVVKAIQFYDINSVGIKFSGRSGFHIIIPYEALPDNINGKDTRLLFPECSRIIVDYIKAFVKNKLVERILSISSFEDISKVLKKDVNKDNFNPFDLVKIDSVAISSRHMIRSPFSLNEKSGLISIPISPNEIIKFNISKAKIENVKVEEKFLKIPEEREAKYLVIQAFDWYSQNNKKEDNLIVKKSDKKYEIPKVKVKEEYFPDCIKKCLRGLPSDGRKRAVFVLINFLRNMGYSYEEIEETLLKWNEKNYEPLREGYIKSQVSWHKRQNKNILPPNCDNPDYYKSIGIKCEDGICNRVKNPVNYVNIKLSNLNFKKKGSK